MKYASEFRLPPPSQSEVLRGVVKWFDPSRGFGFVLVPGFQSEFLLHQNVVRSYGQDSIADGASVDFRYEEQSNGLRVTEVLSIVGAVRSIQYEDIVRPEYIWKDFVPARVKWFDKTKGYGFVNIYGSDEDIFVGHKTLKQAGLQELSFGEALSVQICEARGRKRVHEIQDWPVSLETPTD